MDLDLRTTVVDAAALAFLVGLGLLYVLYDYPASMAPSTRRWTLAVFLQALGWWLFSRRGELPPALSLVVSNGLISLAYTKHIKALRLFVGRPTRPLLLYAPVLGTVLWMVLFFYVVPSVRWRVVGISALFCLQAVAAAGSLVGSGGARRRGQVLTAAAFGAIGVVLATRVVYEYLNAETLPFALTSTPMQILVYSVAAYFPTLATLGFVLMCSDRLYDELERMARIDPLTGLSNRRTFEEQALRAIAAALRSGRSLAVMIVDADHFKRINDAHGHAVGDEALRRISGAMQAVLRGDALVARLGGDEFALVLPDADARAARACGERLCASVEREAFSAGAQAVALRVSIGVALLGPGDDLAALLRRADAALYVAKRDGRNRVHGPADASAAAESTVD